MAPAGENNVPSNRLPYNTRQRQPSTDSETSSISDIQQMDGPGANEYKFVEHTHPNQVLLGLNELRKAGQFCDVTLSVDGTKFPAHRNVLSSFSPYFRAMFLSKLAESKQSVVALRGIEADMLGLLLDYAYTSCIVITRTNVQSLLSAANLLQILPVKDAACDFLERHMDASNCLGIHCFAEQHACTELQNTAKNYALMNFWEVFHQEEFLGLSANKLIELTTSDELEVDKEEAVFQAVARWYNHNPETRKIDFHKVLETVRLPLLSPYFLHDCVESLHVIRQSSECSRLVEEAKLYHLLPDRRSELTSCRTKQRNSADTVEVIVAVGGEDDKVVLRSVECYCTKTRVWKTLNCLPFAVSKHGLVVSGKNTLYLAGGEFPDGSASRSVWRYDPVLDFWLEVASMLVPRSELGLAMLDGFVYAVGGWEGSYRLDSVERYDPSTNSWSLIEPMKLAVTSPAVIAHDGMLYVTGRYSYPQIHIGGAILEDGDGIELVQRYDPRNDMWTELAPMLIPRSGAAICVLDSCIYVIGGWHASTENTNRVERYSVLSNTWEFKASMLERRYRPGIAVMDGLIYVLGGEEGWDRYHDSIECYNPVTDSWCLVGEMPTSRSWLSCAPLQLKEKDRINKTRKSKPSQSKSRFQLQNKIVRCTDFEFEFEFEF